MSLRALLVLLALLASACATPIGVRRVSPQTVYRELNASALSTHAPSAATRRLLQRLGLTERFAKDPEGTLAEIESGLGHPDERDRLFALAELSLIHAGDRGDPAYDLTAAVYAYAFLFPPNPAKEPEPFDPRLRTALGIYNRAIAEGLAVGATTEVSLAARRERLPIGELDLGVQPEGFRYDGLGLENFVSVADYEVRGLRNRYYRQGLGAALVAETVRHGGERANRWLPEHAKVPVTALVRFDDPRRGLSARAIKGQIELYDADTVPVVQIGPYSVPLTSETSTSLAYRLEGSSLWDFEIAGFRRGDFGFSGAREGGLFMLQPYRPGRIPVVFVHGTASSPARWAEMANELLGDPEIANHYQLWFFIYNSGNPIALSAMHLREGIQEAVRDLDPDGTDEALRRMVVIGHSQGGLLTKMTVINSGSKFWNSISAVPFEEADLSPKTRDLVRRSLFIEPLPMVKRVVFISTPHRGSFLAENFLGRIARRLVRLPATVTKVTAELVQLQPGQAARTALHMPTAIDNMDWSTPFLRTLASLPIAPGVIAHSIIPVQGGGPIEEGDDGVVKYRSAHIDGVESELVVRSGHSVQANPQAIEEVRRILYEHAGIGPALAPGEVARQPAQPPLTH